MIGQFWSGKSVFITGHTGFKGGWLSLLLKRYGSHVSGYALAPTHENGIFASARIADLLTESTIADVRDGAQLKQAMSSAAPEIAFHLAAQPLVRASYSDPVTTYETNVMGTVNFLEAVRAVPSVRVAIVITSDKCYENYESSVPFREDDPVGGSDPYSNSKGCAELVVSSYRRSFFSDSATRVATVRAGNVIGGGDWSTDRLIPDLVRTFTERATLRLRYPNAVRPWQHVLEPLIGYLTLAEYLWDDREAYPGAWNFGPALEDTRTVLEVVRIAASLWGEGASWTQDTVINPQEAHQLRLDCSLARSALGWSPTLSLEEAVHWTIAWYLGLYNRTADMRMFTEKQIEDYERLVCNTQRECSIGGLHA